MEEKSMTTIGKNLKSDELNHKLRNVPRLKEITDELFRLMIEVQIEILRKLEDMEAER
jgi:hypothetical protein